MPVLKRLASILLITLVLSGSQIVLAGTAESDAAAIAQLLDLGDYDAAFESLDRALLDHSDDHRLLLQKGFVLVQLGLLDEARIFYLDILESFNHDPEPWNNLAMVYRLQGLHENAVKQLRRTLQKFPDYTRAYENLGDTYLELAGDHYERGAGQLEFQSRLSSKAELIKVFDKLAYENTPAAKRQSLIERQRLQVLEVALQTCEAEFTGMGDSAPLSNAENEERIAQLKAELANAQSIIKNLKLSLASAKSIASQDAISEQAMAATEVFVNPNPVVDQSAQPEAVEIILRGEVVEVSETVEAETTQIVAASESAPKNLSPEIIAAGSLAPGNQVSLGADSLGSRAQPGNSAMTMDNPPQISPAEEMITISAQTSENIELSAVTGQEAILEPLASTARTTYSSLSGASIEQILETIDSWVAAWTNRDVNRYLAHYAEEFKPQGNTPREIWSNRKRRIFSQASFIRVQIDELTLKQTDSKNVTATYVQRYASNTFKEASIATLTLKPQGGRWLIVNQQNQTIE